MKWWKDLKAWLLWDEPKKPADDWDLGRLIVLANPPRTQVEWPATGQSGSDAAATVGPNKITDGESGASSDEKNEPGDGLILPTTGPYEGEPLVWDPVETIEEEPKNDDNLGHASDLPRHTFRVFPTRADGSNGYDTSESVERAVKARKRRPYHYNRPDRNASPIKVYRAETWWIDVTHEYVK